MLGKTLDAEFKLLRIRELDNDDVDDKPDSTDEDSPLSCIGQRVVVQCGADIGWSDEIQVHVMQNNVVYWKWPNVDIYCKRADAIKRSY